jgi:RNA polymerase-binding transcription factor DksA
VAYDQSPAGDDFAVDTVSSIDTASSTTDSAGGELEIELLESIERELADVELALERLGNGSYGSCETCGGAIGDDELEASPARRYCRAHLPASPS